MGKINVRYLLIFLSIMAISAGAAPALGNPFNSTYICFPKVLPDKALLEFKVRENIQCGEKEQWMRVTVQEDKSILLMPSEGPLPKDTKKELKEFKKYHGIY